MIEKYLDAVVLYILRLRVGRLDRREAAVTSHTFSAQQDVPEPEVRDRHHADRLGARPSEAPSHPIATVPKFPGHHQHVLAGRCGDLVGSLKTRDTVMRDTPESLATSLIVAFRSSVPTME